MHLHRPRHYRTRNARHLETPDANCRNTTHAATPTSYTLYHAAALKLNPFAKGEEGHARDSKSTGQALATTVREKPSWKPAGKRPVPVVRKLPIPVFLGWASWVRRERNGKIGWRVSYCEMQTWFGFGVISQIMLHSEKGV